MQDPNEDCISTLRSPVDPPPVHTASSPNPHPCTPRAPRPARLGRSALPSVFRSGDARALESHRGVRPRRPHCAGKGLHTRLREPPREPRVQPQAEAGQGRRALLGSLAGRRPRPTWRRPRGQGATPRADLGLGVSGRRSPVSRAGGGRARAIPLSAVALQAGTPPARTQEARAGAWAAGAARCLCGRHRIVSTGAPRTWEPGSPTSPCTPHPPAFSSSGCYRPATSVFSHVH